MDTRNGIDQNDLKKYNTPILHPSDFYFGNTNNMSHISAHVRLRPVRFAFMVRPDDKKRALCRRGRFGADASH
jgi:hypothetical protein